MSKVYTVLRSESTFSRVITILDQYHERFCLYKQTGGNFVIDYELTLIPTDNDDVTVSFIADKPTSIVIAPIAKGIEDYISDQNKKGNEVSGFDVLIQNVVLHPVDYRPDRTAIYTHIRFREIFLKHGIKRYFRRSGEVLYGPPIITEALNPLESVSNLMSKSPFNMNFDLPHVHKAKLVFPSFFCIKEILIENRYDPLRIKLKVASLGYSERYINQVYVLTERSDGCIQTTFLVNEVIDLFIRDIYDQGYNLGGFAVWILESDLIYLNQNAQVFQNELLWLLKYLLLSGNEEIQSI
ncbi:hypothetical protein [Pedobacter sp. KBW06]|uniref:hypothetical protein n=1 Tax=Pedobacter sp. KBW06 TaxID=2153359 RepID=UPI000F5B32C1|nr:hypothetical protein [Pedobacter sp. KBW06]